MNEREFIGRINIDRALKSGWWQEVRDPAGTALWGKHAQSTKLELNLLSRHYSLIVDEEVDIQDPESGPLYVEAWDPTEEDLDAINEGLQRRANEGGRVLKASAVRITSRLGLLWVQGSAGAEEIQISTNVDYQSTFASELLDPYEQISLDVYNSVSLQELECKGWL